MFAWFFVLFYGIENFAVGANRHFECVRVYAIFNLFANLCSTFHAFPITKLFGCVFIRVLLILLL